MLLVSLSDYGFADASKTKKLYPKESETQTGQAIHNLKVTLFLKFWIL